MDGLKYYHVKKIIDFIFINGGIKLLFQAVHDTTNRLLNEWQSEVHQHHGQYSPSSLMRTFKLERISSSFSINSSRTSDDMSRKLIDTKNTYSYYVFTDYLSKLNEKHQRNVKIDQTFSWPVIHGIPLTLGILGGALAALLAHMTRRWSKTFQK